MSADERIAAVTARYDGDDHEGERLQVAALRRLSWRSRHSGKTCSSCGEDRSLSEFGPDSSKPDGLSRRCRGCRAKREAAHRRRRKAATV